MNDFDTAKDHLDRLRKVAGIRQGVINKLEKRVARLEAENRKLKGENK